MVRSFSRLRSSVGLLIAPRGRSAAPHRAGGAGWRLRAILLALAVPAALPVAAAPWHPPAGADEVALWPAGVPLAEPELTGPEKVTVDGNIAGRPVTAVENVSRPTMAVFPAKGRPTGAAVLVFPGGGYKMLAIDFEGTEVCDWITAKGIACAVLKYRVPQTWWPKDGRGQRPPVPRMSLQDAQRAMALLRAGAARWRIDPKKLGVMGFSAGGHMVEQVSNAAALSYRPVDAADRQPTRPDWAVALYPGHLWAGSDGRGVAETDLRLYPFDPVRADAPPTFLLQAENDEVDDVRDAMSYFLALRAHKVPAELHVYPTGGHAFGLRPTAEPITRWPVLVEAWLHRLGMM